VVYAGEIPVAARLPRQISAGPRIPAWTFQRGGCISCHRAELEHRNSDDRLREISGGEGLSGADEEASGDRKSAGRGVRALQGRDRAAQGGCLSAKRALQLPPFPLRGGVGGGGT